MALVLAASFDHGTSAGWVAGIAGIRYADSLGGTPTIVLDGASYWLEISQTTGTAEYLHWDSNTTGATGNRLAAFYRLRFPGALPSGNVQLQALSSPGTDPVLAYRTTGTRLAVCLDGGTTFIDGPAVVADTTYEVELYCDLSANPNRLDWVVDGVAQTQATRAVVANTFDGFRLGGTDGVGTFNVRFRDAVVWTDTAAIGFPVGPHKVVLLKADTGGATTQIGTTDATARMVTNSAIDATHNSAQILAALAEGPPFITGGSASGLGQRTSGATNACAVPMTTYTLTGGETSPGLRVIVPTWAANATAAANTLGVRAYNGSAETILFAAGAYGGVNTATPSWICEMYTAATSQAELDALEVRVGYSADIAPLPGVHAVYADVAVKEGSGAVAELPILVMAPPR